MATQAIRGETTSSERNTVHLDPMGYDGVRRMRRREQIFDTRGRCVAQLSMAPPLYVMRTISAQKRHRPLSLSERRSALHHAADIFVNDELAGIAFDDYIRLTSRVSGLPIRLTRDQILGVARDLSSVFEGMWPARPTGAALDWRAEGTRSGSAVWVRRGETFAVLAPGNAPGVHGLWLQALALGYRVIVRPSRREPFTGHRLVNALRKAGFRCDDIAYLPTDYVGADEIIHSADLSMVYGGQDVVDKYARNSNVFTNGPGKSKILITAEQHWRDYLDVIVDSIAGLGGMACVNTTAVLYEGNPAPLAQAIADRLRRIEPLPADNEQAVLPVQTLVAARRLAEHLERVATGTVPILGAGQVVAPLGNGEAALRPAVHVVPGADPDKLNTELAFPCVWVAPWSRASGFGPLRNSLVLNAITTDEHLLDDLLAEPTITNLYSGHHRTHYRHPRVPHDGFLADFLMRNKGCIRD
jgi:acyl-CoA reductase-like NAD-dependent aldehyde dehydrogenase